MVTTFENAPLVEIIAELRWSPEKALNQVEIGHGTVVRTLKTTDPASVHEQFFSRFSDEISKSGFTRTERLLPAGFPAMPFQPVYRYRKTSDAEGTVLYQLGSGLFSANAIPPYRSWESFSPVVASGIDAMLVSRTDAERNAPFSSVSLRYIDAFGPSLTEGRGVSEFIRDVLNIRIDLPDAFMRHALRGASPKPLLQFTLPLEQQLVMAITLGEGEFNNETAILMDATVSSSAPVTPAREAVLDVLTSAREIMHGAFLDLTKPIEQLMRPRV